MRVGVEYLGEPKAAMPAGITSGKSLPFLWQECQAYPGAPFYWKTFDERVAAWERAGFFDVCVVIKSKHTRLDMARATVTAATEIATLATLQASAPPVDPSAYARFVRETVKRYRGRVSAWQIESEQTDYTHWMGTAREYVQLVEIASNAIAVADPQALIVLGGMGFGDALDDLWGVASDVLEDELVGRVDTLAEPWRSINLRALSFGQECLEACPWVDVIGLHSLSAASGISPGAALLQRYAHGAALWIDDATSAPVCVYDPNGFNQPSDPWTMTVDLLQLLRGDSATLAKRERQQAEMVAAKIDQARVVGATRINFCSLGQWGVGPQFGTLSFQQLREPALDVVRAAQS